MTKEELFQQGSSFSPAHRDDIAGIDSTLEYIDTIINWLLHSKTFTSYKSRLEPGILFEGRPGTGKTLCARYIATESNALFVNIRDWPKDQFSARDISDIFQRAREYYKINNKPVILFWDEFEAFAQDRGSVGHNPRLSSVVSQLTAELDGIHGKCEGILLIGCTNFKDSIDSALLRPGRMGIHIRFNAPDRNGKSRLLNHYLNHFNVANDFDYTAASFFFEDHDTAATIEEAAQKVWLQAIIDSVTNNTDPIIDNELANDVLLKRLLGMPPPFMELKSDTYRRVAIHELGHALVAYELKVPIQIITIQPGEDTFGRTYLEQPYDKIATVEDIQKQIGCLVGSVFSEQAMGLDLSAGIANDLTKATKLAVELTNSVGNTNRIAFEGWLSRAAIPGSMSDTMSTYFDSHTCDLLNNIQTLANTIITRNKDYIDPLATRLVADKTWTGPQFYQEFEDVRA